MDGESGKLREPRAVELIISVSHIFQRFNVFKHIFITFLRF